MSDDARSVFDRRSLARICELPETAFGLAFGLDTFEVPQAEPEDFYLFRDNGSSILAVAHLDTVAPHYQRSCQFAKTAAGLVVHSRALDDRLGAYIVLDVLPQLNIECDVLLTVGEEMGMSTAAYFEPPKQYDWMIEFDRGGTDVVMYQYDDAEVRALVKQAGAYVGDGIFSDICYLEHLEIKGFNWGVGYRDYHTSRAHAYLEDTFDMVDQFQEFHRLNNGLYMPHYETQGARRLPWYMYDDVEDGKDDLRTTEDVDMPDDWDERDPFHWSDSWSQRIG